MIQISKVLKAIDMSSGCDHVEKEETKEKFVKEALAAWSSYKQTGKYLTGDEVREWLQTWGTNNEIGLPECHE